MRAVRRRREQRLRLETLRRASPNGSSMDGSQSSQSSGYTPSTLGRNKKNKKSPTNFDDMFGPSQSLLQEYSVDFPKNAIAPPKSALRRGQVRQVLSKKQQRQEAIKTSKNLAEKKRQDKLLRKKSKTQARRNNSQANRLKDNRPQMMRNSSMSSTTLGSALSFSASLSSCDLLASAPTRLSFRGSKLAAALMRRPSQEEQPTVTLSDGVPVADVDMMDYSGANFSDNNSDNDEEEDVTPFADMDLMYSSSPLPSMSSLDYNNNNNNKETNNKNNKENNNNNNTTTNTTTTNNNTNNNSGFWRPVLTQDNNVSSPKLLSVLTTDDDPSSTTVFWRAPRTPTAEESDDNNTGGGGGSLRNLFSFRSKGEGSKSERRRRLQTANAGSNGNSGRSLGGMSVMSTDSSVTLESRATSPGPVLSRRQQITTGGRKFGSNTQRQQQYQRNNGSSSSNGRFTNSSASSSQRTFASEGHNSNKKGGNGTLKRNMSRKELRRQRNASSKDISRAQSSRSKKSSSSRSIKSYSTKSVSSTHSGNRSSSSCSSQKPRVFIKSDGTRTNTSSGRSTSTSGRSNKTHSGKSTFSSSSSISRVYIKTTDTPDPYDNQDWARNFRNVSGCADDEDDMMLNADVTPWDEVGLADADVVGSLGRSFNRMLSGADLFNTAYAKHIPNTTESADVESNGSLPDHMPNTAGSSHVLARKSSSGSVVPDAFVGTGGEWDSRLLAVRKLRMKRTLSQEEAADRSKVGSMDV